MTVAVPRKDTSRSRTKTKSTLYVLRIAKNQGRTPDTVRTTVLSYPEDGRNRLEGDGRVLHARAVSLKIAKLAFQRIRQYAPLDDRLRRVNLQVIRPQASVACWAL